MFSVSKKLSALPLHSVVLYCVLLIDFNVWLPIMWKLRWRINIRLPLPGCHISTSPTSSLFKLVLAAVFLLLAPFPCCEILWRGCWFLYRAHLNRILRCFRQRAVGYFVDGEWVPTAELPSFRVNPGKLMSYSSWGSSCQGFPARKGSLNDIKRFSARRPDCLLMNSRQLIPISGTPGAVMKIGRRSSEVYWMLNGLRFFFSLLCSLRLSGG